MVLALAPKVFLRVLPFSSLLKNQHFEIPIRSGIRGPRVYQLKNCCVSPSLNRVNLFYLFIYFIYSNSTSDFSECNFTFLKDSHRFYSVNELVFGSKFKLRFDFIIICLCLPLSVQNKTHKCCSCLSSVYWAIKINTLMLEQMAMDNRSIAAFIETNRTKMNSVITYLPSKGAGREKRTSTKYTTDQVDG